MAVERPRKMLEIDGGVRRYPREHVTNILCAQAWKKLFRSAWDGFREAFSDILTELKKHQTLLEKEGHLANFENVNLMTKDLEKRDEQNREQQLADACRWLSAADYSADQDHFLSLRNGFLDTCMWLLQKKDMISWQDSNSDVSIFWLHGILGSGMYHFIKGLSFDGPLDLMAVIRENNCNLLCC